MGDTLDVLTVMMYSIGEMMSKRPPEDNPIIAEILRQLGEVLGPEDIDELTREAMKEALWDTVPWTTTKTSDSNISVMEGGKESVEKEPDISERRSQFHIVDEDSLPQDEAEPFPDVQVRVLSSEDFLGSQNVFGLNPTLKQEIKRGAITVGEGQEQILAVRNDIQAYRISCEEGAWVLSADTNSFELSQGQSIDIEAEKISVKGLLSSNGWFHLL